MSMMVVVCAGTLPAHVTSQASTIDQKAPNPGLPERWKAGVRPSAHHRRARQAHCPPGISARTGLAAQPSGCWDTSLIAAPSHGCLYCPPPMMWSDCCGGPSFPSADPPAPPPESTLSECESCQAPLSRRRSIAGMRRVSNSVPPCRSSSQPLEIVRLWSSASATRTNPRAHKRNVRHACCCPAPLPADREHNHEGRNLGECDGVGVYRCSACAGISA